MRLALALTISALTAGCAGHQPPTWYQADVNDKFRDVHGCRTTIGSEDVGSYHYTFAGNLYPFVQKVGDELKVGVTSMAIPGSGSTTFRPSVPLPVGDIEMKIDDNPTWVLAAAETRVVEVPGSTAALTKQQVQESIQSMSQNNPALAASMAAMPETARKLMLPYTTVTGEKAKEIVEQMRTGRIVAFRQIATPFARSFEYPTTGLQEQLKRCGI